MKIIKKISLIALIAVLGFTFVGCGEYSVLDNLNTVTRNISSTSETLSNFNQSDLEFNLTQLSYSEDNGPMLLSDSDESTPLQTFIELRSQVIILHSDILISRTNIIASRIEIKDLVDYIKSNQIMLLDDDKAIIQDTITDLKTLRDNLLETKGLAYKRLIDLKGTYTRENLPEINQVYTEVIPVLESRLEMFKNAEADLNTIIEILNDYYME